VTADLRDRITDQFSGRGDRADIWRVFDWFLETDAYLNLGYSPRYLPHLVGSSQRRLATLVGETLAADLDATTGVGLLDVGCGRGGPAHHLASRFGFSVVGIDLVATNVARAREHGTDAEYVVGDATHLPFRDGAFRACTAIDAVVYLPDRTPVFTAVADVLEPGGTFVFSDLLWRADSDVSREAITAFADAWDMPTPGTRADYRRALDAAGFEAVRTTDLTPHSVGRFRRWTTLYRRVAATPLRAVLAWWLTRQGVDPDAIETQIARAHAALPALEHVLVVAHTPT